MILEMAANMEQLSGTFFFPFVLASRRSRHTLNQIKKSFFYAKKKGLRTQTHTTLIIDNLYHQLTLR